MQTVMVVSGASERFWNQTPFRSYLFNAFSLLLPSGEQFVIRAMEDAATRLPEGAPLQEEVAQFVRDVRRLGLLGAPLKHDRTAVIPRWPRNRRRGGGRRWFCCHEIHSSDPEARLSPKKSDDWRLFFKARLQISWWPIQRAAVLFKRITSR